MPPTTTWVPFGWPVVIYLCLAGLAAGAGLVAAGGTLRGCPGLARRATVLATAAVIVGAASLVADLEVVRRFWRIPATFHPSSAISWGARILTLFASVALLHALFAGTGGSRERGSPRGWPRGLAAGLAFAAVALAAYPGLVLAQQAAARPAWGGPWLTLLLLASALHMGSALLSAPGLRRPAEPRLLAPALHRRVEVVLVLLQSVLAALWILGVQAGSPAAAHRLLAGPPAPPFWLGFGVLGLAVPGLFAGLGSRRRDPGDPGAWRLAGTFAAPVFGGCCLRIAILFGGQGAAAFS